MNFIKLDPRLEALSTDESRDPDVVKGVVGVILDELPPQVATAGYDDLLYGHGFCFVDALRLVSLADLRGEPLDKVSYQYF